MKCGRNAFVEFNAFFGVLLLFVFKLSVPSFFFSLRSFACLSFMSKLFPLIRHRNSVSKWKNSKRKAWNLTRPAASLVESVCFRYGEESSVNLIIQWPFLCFATRSNPSASSLNVIHHYRQPISAIAYYEVHHLFSCFFSFDVEALSVSSRTFFGFIHENHVLKRPFNKFLLGPLHVREEISVFCSKCALLIIILGQREILQYSLGLSAWKWTSLPLFLSLPVDFCIIF